MNASAATELDVTEEDLIKCERAIIEDFKFAYFHPKIGHNDYAYIRNIYGRTVEDCCHGMDILLESSKQIIQSIRHTYDHTQDDSELFHHRIWLTYPHNAIEPKEELVQNYIESIILLKTTKQRWKTIFWCLDQQMIPNTIQALKSADIGIEICDIKDKDWFIHFYGSHLFWAAIDYGLFALAADILRQNILFEYGGIYTDFGSKFLKNPAPFMQCSDLMVHFRKGRKTPGSWWIDQDLIAAKPFNPIISQFLHQIDVLYIFDQISEITSFFNTPWLMNSLTNAHLLTSLLQCFPMDCSVFIAPDNESIVQAFHQTSWMDGDHKSCKDLKKTTMNWFKIQPDYAVSFEHRLLMDQFNTSLYQKYFSPHLADPQDLVRDFLSTPYGVVSFDASSQQYPVVVTLTSWPGKIANAHIALISLLRQSFKPNRLILWLSELEFPHKEIPCAINSLLDKGLEIRWCDNIRSYKKLIPALEAEDLQECIFITADDDVLYPVNWLQNLMEKHQEYPFDIIANRSRVVTYNADGELKPYAEWPLCFNKIPCEHDIYFPTGCGGVLYPPHCLEISILNREDFMSICDTGDDIFFFAAGILKRTKTRMINNQQEIIDLNDEKMNAVSLFHSVNKKGKNDEMIRDVFERYGIHTYLKTLSSASFL